MSDDHSTGATPADPTPERVRAFQAMALGLVGALGGGTIATGIQWLFVSRDAGHIVQNFLGLVPLALGVAAFWMVNELRSADPVAVPVARAAQVLAAVAVVGGALLLLSALTSDT
jgi:hypothetical protein